MGNQQAAKQNSSCLIPLADVLAELEMRFLSNLPAAELNNAVRVFMQVEQAHWFYEDFFVDKYTHLKSMKMPVFAKALFEQSDVLASVAHKSDNFYTQFKNYRHQIPVCGAIMLNEQCDKVLLVRSWQGKSWTFPRGKINEGEIEHICAAREVYEETGYMPEIDPAIHTRLEANDHGKSVILYVVPGVAEGQHFAPLARKEVSKIEWFPLNAIPKGHYNVQPFMGRLKKIASNLRKQSRKANKNLNTSTSNKKPCNNLSPNSQHQHGRKSKQQRSHFGTEQDRDFDTHNQNTFEEAVGGVGTVSGKGWSIEDMFAANSKLTGLEYTYDGNAQNFGDTQCKAKRVGEDNQKSLWRAQGNEHVTSDATSPRSAATTQFSPTVAALFASAAPPAPTPEPTTLNPAVAALFAAAAAPPPAPMAPQSCAASTSCAWKGGLLMPMLMK